VHAVRVRRFLAVLASTLCVTTLSAAGWPTDHGDNLRTGYLPAQARYHGLTMSFTRTLDGAVYGSPIIAGANLVVATENNTVYALDPATGAVRWSHHLYPPVPLSSLPCGNIDPLGITGTPAYDAATGRVFVVTESADPKTVVRHEVFGLDAGTGATEWHRPIEVPGTDPKAEQQRAALAVRGSSLYVAYGGLTGDCGNYRGAVISVPTSGALGARAYVVPTSREAGIWAPGGPVVDSAGRVIVAIGNGESTSGAYDYSDSVTSLNPNMTRHDFFAPSSWASDNAQDFDLGSLTPVLTSNGYLLQAGKSGNGYVLRQSHLGLIGGQVFNAPLCRAFGVAAVTGNIVYLPCTDGVTRVEVTANGTFSKKWTATGIPGSPAVGNGAVFSMGDGTLYALSAQGQRIGSFPIGSTTRFATPALGPNRVYVGTTTGVTAVRVDLAGGSLPGGSSHRVGPVTRWCGR